MGGSPGFSFRSTRGGDPVDRIKALKKAVQITEGDILYAGQRQRTRILDRTRAGVDMDGSPFARYSTKGPYYYNPTGGQAGRSLESQVSATKRLKRKIEKGKPGGGGMRLSRTGRTMVFEDGYAGFKAWLGRIGVDLTGPRAPHMMQAIQTKVEGLKMLILGIYGPKADIAQGHNEGTRHLPRRHFFGASSADLKQMVRDIADHISARVKAS